MASGPGCALVRGEPSLRAVAPRAGRASPSRPTDVRRVLATASSAAGARVVLYGAPRAGRTDVAFVVSRRVGGAVIRNRARRVMRAAWREVAPSVGDGFDVVFVAR